MTSCTPQGCNGVLLNFSKPETRAKEKGLLGAEQHRIDTTETQIRSFSLWESELQIKNFSFKESELQIRSFSFREYPQLGTEVNVCGLQLFKLSPSPTDVSDTNQFPQFEMQTNSLSCCCGIPCSPVSHIQGCSWFPVFSIWSLHVTSVSLDGFDDDVVHCKKNSKASNVRKEQLAWRKVICIYCWHQTVPLTFPIVFLGFLLIIASVRTPALLPSSAIVDDRRQAEPTCPGSTSSCTTFSPKSS